MWVLDGNIIPSGGICGAILNNDLEKFKSYLKFYIPPDKPFYRDISFSKIFKIAYAFCRFEIVELLIEYGADVNKENCHSYEWKMSEFQTPLTYLCDKKLDVDYYEYFNDFDAMKPYFETIKILLKYGADVNVKNKNSKTPLMLFCENNQNTFTEISFETIKLLLKYGADVNVKDKDGKTPLMLSCEWIRNAGLYDIKNFEIIKLLLEYGADVNAKDKNGKTPLLKFCEGVAGHRVKEVNVFKIVKLLLEYGAEVNVEGSSILWSLCSAKSNGLDDEDMMIGEAIKLLLEYGADVNVKNFRGTTILELYGSILKPLLAQGADTGAKK